MKTLHLFSHFGSSKLPYNGKANRCSGKVRTEFSSNDKSYKHKTTIKFNLKPE